MAASSRIGMGALAYDGGVTVRVWAPFASAVSVAGTFNQWNPQAAPLAREDNGYWSTDVPGAELGNH
jgi:1,4-alpha-glucan branching enzyme